MDIKRITNAFFIKMLFVFVVLQGTSFNSVYAQASFPNGEQGIFGPKQYVRTTGSPNIYEDTFAATPGPGYLIIHNGESDSKHRVTSALIFINNEQIYEPKDFKQDVYILELPVDLNQTNTIRVELRSKPGTYLTIELGQVLPSVNLTLAPETILFGESTTLSWNSTMATSCSIEPEIGEVDVNGSITLTPTETTTYTITATAVAGTASDSATVTVIPPPTVTLSADPETINQGEASTLSWESTNTNTCTIEPGVGIVDTSGSISVTPDQTTQYIITATGPGGSASSSVTVQVEVPSISVSINADPEIVVMGNCQQEAMVNDIDTIYESIIAPRIIIWGTPVTLSWTSTNAETCVIEPNVGNVDVNGERVVYVTFPTTFTITATGPEGTATDQVFVDVIVCPQFWSLSADPTTIYRGAGSSELYWWAIRADTVTIEPGIGNVDLIGTITVSPTETTTYTLTATSAQGYYVTEDITITVVDPPPSVSIEAVPEEILLNGVSTLTWQSEYAESCVIEPDIGSVDANGSIEVSPSENTTYTITATGPGGQATATTTVTFQPPSVDFSANPNTIQLTNSSTLSWTSINAISCNIEPDIGEVDTSGSIVVTPKDTTTYTITATGPGGTFSSSTLVTVTSPITIEIVSPETNETIGRSDIFVEGTINNLLNIETGIIVNGVDATVYGNRFTANHVPLSGNDDIISAVATDIQGNTAISSKTVFMDTFQKDIQLLTDLEVGLSPNKAKLEIKGRLSISESSLTHDGPGIVNYTSTGIDQYEVEIIGEGIYQFTAYVTTDQGTVYNDTIAVTIFNKIEIDALLKSRWEGMKINLTNTNIEGALNQFLEGAKDKYREAFYAIAPDRLNEIASTMREIQMIYVRNDSAKYVIKREETIQSVPHDISYFIYFIKDRNGLWKLNSF